MKILDIKLTYNCNNHCCLCCQNDRIKNCSSDISLDSIYAFIDSFPKDDTISTKIVLTGGEPTLHPQILEIIRYIRDSGYKNIQLQSNLTLQNSNIVLNDLLKSGITNFGISLHGHNAEIHEKFTCTKGSFDCTVRNLKLLSSLRIPVSLNCVLSRYNISYLSDIVEFVQSNSLADSIQFAFIHIMGRAELRHNLIPRISEAATEVHKAIRLIGNSKITVKTEAIPFCLMRGFEKHVAELEKLDDIVVLDKTGVLSFSEHRMECLKSKTARCKQCLFFSMCEGPWREYPSIFGWDEFEPVRSVKG